VENPWLKLPSKALYVLEIPNSLNGTMQGKPIRSDTPLIPEPFIGNPSSAKLVLLNLNPGLAQSD
jgi:hypothetical protein